MHLAVVGLSNLADTFPMPQLPNLSSSSLGTQLCVQLGEGRTSSFDHGSVSDLC